MDRIQGSVLLTLTRAEALILFEWLARADSPDKATLVDDLTEKVLWKMEGQLEKLLPEPLAPNYKQLLAAARKEVRDTNEE